MWLTIVYSVMSYNVMCSLFVSAGRWPRQCWSLRSVGQCVFMPGAPAADTQQACTLAGMAPLATEVLSCVRRCWAADCTRSSWGQKLVWKLHDILYCLRVRLCSPCSSLKSSQSRGGPLDRRPPEQKSVLLRLIGAMGTADNLQPAFQVSTLSKEWPFVSKVSCTISA